MKRTILIGDLHGCYDEALELLDRVGAAASDRVIFLGDLVDRGPKQRECVELAMRHECVLGNHEEKHLRLADSPFAEFFDYFRSLPTFIRLPEYGAAAVHAGAYPGVPLEAQEPYHLCHVQCIQPPHRKSYWPSKAPADFTFWTRHWRGPERLVFGHSVLDTPLVSEHAVGIDTGAVFGRALTALVLPDWRLVSVKARRQYMQGKGGVARYPVHEGVSAYS